MNLYELGLIDAQAGIAAGKFSAGEYLESCIGRTLAVDGRVGAFAHFDLSMVRQSLSAQGSVSGPLAKLPIGIKDIIATKGVPTEMGSAAFKGHVPDHSAWVVETLERASAIPFGKTVTTEFAWRHPGKTRNPWNLAHTPGGSSSGSAAAVAYGAVPAALGTQTFGSIIRPAVYCGVVGYKPSFGVIPRTGVYPLAESLDHLGVFTRNVADAALLASMLTGRDNIDFLNTPSPSPTWPLLAGTPANRPPALALIRTTAWHRASAEQQALIDETVQKLTAAGAIVRVVELPPAFNQIWALAQTICDAEGAVVNARFAHEVPPRVSVPILELVARGEGISATDFIRAKDSQRTLIREFATLMAPFDAALTSPATGEAPEGLDNTGDAVFCIPFSVLGSPAITLPAATSNAGLPLGIQLVGSWGQDLRLLQSAIWVEACLARVYRFPVI